jgi:hypothetical protein
VKGKESAKILEEHLKNNDWHYEREEHSEGAIFSGGVGGLGGAYDSVRFIVSTDDDFIQSYALLPAKAKDKLPEMAEFLHRANYGLRYGAFEMDWNDGEIRFHISYPDCVLATEERETCLAALLLLPPQMFARYSKGIAAILLGLATPEQAIKMCEGEE